MVSDVRQIEIHTAEQLVPDRRPFEAESVIVPVYKKGDKDGSTDNRGTSPLSTFTKLKVKSIYICIYMCVCVDDIIGDHQCGFRRNRSTVDQILCIRQLLEKKCEYS
jgi:hypothetical protein